MKVQIQRAHPSGLTLELIGMFGTAADTSTPFRAALGVDFPRVNQAIRTERLAILGVAPDKALIVGRGAARAPALQGFSRVDLAHARTLFEISGPDARALLAKGTPFHAEHPAFDASACAATRFAGLAVLIEPLASDRLRLHVASSYAQHVEEWLRDAALEETSGAP
jgi:sarcosine oxidase subunit gamma